ncbi:hypothetical protein KL932_003182 [Ogataea haglerorum]|nr:hypothetical protein KL932_003182 [Ogataea haglerorum]
MGLELFEYRIITKDGFVITLQRIVDPTRLQKFELPAAQKRLRRVARQQSVRIPSPAHVSQPERPQDVGLGPHRNDALRRAVYGRRDSPLHGEAESDADRTFPGNSPDSHAAVERVRDGLRGQDLGVRASGAGDFWRFAVELQGLYSFHQAAAQLALRLVFRNQLVHAGHDGSAQNHSHHAGVWVSELRDVQLPVRLDRLSLGQEPETVPFHFLAGVRFGETDEVVAQQAPRTGFPNGQVIAEKRAGVVLEEDAPAVPGDRGARQTGGRQPFRATSGTQGARNARPFQLH